MLEFILYTKTRAFVRQLIPTKVHAELLNNQVSFAELTFDDDDPALSDIGNGSRVEMRVNGKAELAGPIVDRAGGSQSASVTLRVEDDFRLFRNVGWPTPGSPIGSQTSEYRRYSGPTETVVKAACADLSTVYGLGWTNLADKGLGTTQRVEVRFHPLVDKLTPLLNADGLRWTIRGNQIDVTAGTLFPRILTPDTGVLADYTWRVTAPSATRVVVGGAGEGTARLLQQFVKTTRESDWGFVAAAFKDARMAQGVTDLSPDGAEALAEADGKASITADLVETSWFRFGKYAVGDRLRVKVGPVDVTETITQVVIEDSADNGLTFTPHLGAIETDGDDQLAKDIARLQVRARDLGSR